MVEAKKHIVVTGAAGGIGEALAEHFLLLGWRVTGIDIAPFADRLATCSHFAGLAADITDEAGLQQAFGSGSPVDTVIANAAVTDTGHHLAVDMPYDTWRRVLRTNVDGAFLTARCAARQMRHTGGGNIVFVTSSLARLTDAQAGDAPYCTSKAAVEMLSQVLAIEFAEHGINVNTLFPSVMIDSGFFAHWEGEKRGALSRPCLLNETAEFLATLPGGAVTGRSLDQQLWDDNAAYRATWEAPS